ncbi:WXG100 family type VII secretion target [Actinoallomurus acaciae]|uniref:WXG100 family type VII secretion target n=1 Tax=Actinoallomurus acaciae TaxID=502577 RepID=A0ABV5YK06_9ACTN
MPIAEVAQSLFAAINADAIIGCGSAIKEISSLYGTLGSTIDTAHQQLFTGDTTWSGTAASKAKNTMTDLTLSSSNIQSALSTIGDTLVAYGTALKPFQGKVYPTPVPGSRDPEAAADLAITGTASAAAALEIGAAVLKMMPTSKQGTKSANKADTSTKSATPTDSTTTGDGTTLAGLPNPAHVVGSLTSNPALTGAVLPGPSNGTPPLGPFMSAAGVIGSAEEAAVIQASEAAAMREGMPLIPMTGTPSRKHSERSRTTTLTEDPEFWTALMD